MGHLGNTLSAISSLVPRWLGPRREPLETVGEVDIQRYAGKWYEIAALPMIAERGCHDTTASYRVLGDGEVEVINRCIDAHGAVQEIEGRAWVPDPRKRGQLLVQFYWPMRADYFILALGDDYEYAMVGHPSRHHLWILSRAPYLDPSIYQRLLDQARAQGYDLLRLRRTSHAPRA